MTRLLFRDDAYATTFEGRVLAARGSRVRLDRTLFYPEGGGQSPDVGRLAWDGGEARVVDVQKEGGEVWHELQGDVPEANTSVSGEIDWRTRYRHMQRHTGEHLLAQAFLRVNPNFRVRAVSMRSAECTLDLEGHPTPQDARAAEQIMRDVIARDLRIETFEVPEQELNRYPLRRPPQVRGAVRLVGVREGEGWWEMSACGGTHLKSSAFAAPVVVLGLEKIKGDLTRATFVAGEEATEFLAETYRTAKAAAQLLSAPAEKLEDRVKATLDEGRQLRSELEGVRAELAKVIVESAETRLLPNAIRAKLVRVPEAALVSPALKALAALPNTVGAVLSPDGRCGAASSVPEVHAGKLLGAWLKEAGGRGGGKPDVAQGQTGSAAAFEQVVRAAWETP